MFMVSRKDLLKTNKPYSISLAHLMMDEKFHVDVPTLISNNAVLTNVIMLIEDKARKKNFTWLNSHLLNYLRDCLKYTCSKHNERNQVLVTKVNKILEQLSLYTGDNKTVEDEEQEDALWLEIYFLCQIENKDPASMRDLKRILWSFVDQEDYEDPNFGLYPFARTIRMLRAIHLTGIEEASDEKLGRDKASSLGSIFEGNLKDLLVKHFKFEF